MAKPKKKRAAPQTKSEPAKPVESTPVSKSLFGLGLILLALCIAASGMLALEHFAVALPGCGPGSGCAKAARSVWGSVPGVGWPTSFVGLAYFAGLLIGWLRCRGGVAEGFRWLVRFGALASAGFIAVMLIGGYLCPYCLTVQIANLAFFALVERSQTRSAGARPALLSVAAVFLVASLVLWPIEAQHQARLERQRESDLKATIDELTNRTNDTDQAIGDTGDWFTGRYRLGPEKAAIRVVAFTDFQCPDCRRVEGEIMAIFRERSDMSVSMKHFPMCTDCNVHVKGQNMHPNACWAARAAEAAGMLRGNEGFWQMHDWLFEVRGSFTGESLHPAARRMGFEPSELTETMMGAETEALVKQDIEEAISLGMYFTPMVFINGTEIKGYGAFANNAIRRAIDALAATNPPPRTAAADRPPGAIENYLLDWRGQRVRTFGPDPHDWSRGPENATVRIVVWGDYEESGTRELDRALAALTADQPDVRYSFRHYPFNQSCNPVVTRTQFPGSCLAAQAVEAAGRVGGADGFWRMHEWLMKNAEPLGDRVLRTGAAEAGLDPAAIMAGMGSTDVAQAIREDCEAAKLHGIRGIPFLFINDRFVPRWRLEGQPVLERMIAEARAESSDEG